MGRDVPGELVTFSRRMTYIPTISLPSLVTEVPDVLCIIAVSTCVIVSKRIPNYYLRVPTIIYACNR